MRRLTTAFMTVVLQLGCTGLALADASDTTVDADATTDARPPGLDEVVVTALRRSREDLQSTPVTATVVSSDQIQNLQIDNLLEAKTLVPGLTMKVLNIQNLALNVRGFGNADGDSLAPAPTGVPIYVDGVYFPRPGTALMDIPDLTGLQVLKGPQGTAGGYDSITGAVVANVAIPSFQAGQTLSLGYGNYNDSKLHYSATGPIAGSDWAAYRVSIFGDYNDGWLHSVNPTDRDVYNKKFDRGFRGQILLQPSSDLTVRLEADYSYVNYNCCANVTTGAITHYANGTPIAGNFFEHAAAVGYTPQSLNGLQRFNTDLSGEYGTGPEEAADNTGAAVHIDYNMNGYAINSVTAFRKYDYHCYWYNNTIINVDINRQGCGDGNSQSVQEDFSVSTPTNRTVEAKAGVFAFWETFRSPNYSWMGGQSSAWYLQPATPEQTVIDNAAINFAKLNSYDRILTRNLSPYAQAVWHATDRLDVTAGARFTESWKSGLGEGEIIGQSLAGLTPAEQAAALATRLAVFGGPATWNYRLNTAQSLPSGLLKASYKITPDILAYVSYGHGTRPGGPNVGFSDIPQGAATEVKAEQADNYEIGLKTDLLNHRLQANISAFLVNDRNYITNVSQITGAGTTITYLANAPKARSEGIEFDVRAEPTDSVTVYGSGTYNDAKYISFPSAPCPFELSNQATCSLTGKPLSFTPKWSFAAGADYSQSIGKVLPQLSDVTFFIGPDYSWQSETQSGTFGDNSDSIYSVIGSYGILDGHAGLRSSRSAGWNVTAWVHNATDKRYCLVKSSDFAGAGLVGCTPGEPRMYGATVSFSF